MEALILLLLILLIALFCWTLYKLKERQCEERKLQQNEDNKSSNVVSMCDPMKERLKSNLELFLQAEDALARDDSIEYITLKAQAINSANKILGKDLKGVINNVAAK